MVAALWLLTHRGMAAVPPCNWRACAGSKATPTSSTLTSRKRKRRTCSTRPAGTAQAPPWKTRTMHARHHARQQQTSTPIFTASVCPHRCSRVAVCVCCPQVQREKLDGDPRSADQAGLRTRRLQRGYGRHRTRVQAHEPERLSESRVWWAWRLRRRRRGWGWLQCIRRRRLLTHTDDHDPGCCCHRCLHKGLVQPKSRTPFACFEFDFFCCKNNVVVRRHTISRCAWTGKSARWWGHHRGPNRRRACTARFLRLYVNPATRTGPNTILLRAGSLQPSLAVI